MKDIQLLKDADKLLSKCGRPLRASDGTVFLPLPKYFFYQSNHAPSTITNEARNIFGDTVFLLRSMAIVPPVNDLYFRLQFPNGRFLQNVNRLMSQVANTASQRYPIIPEVPCQPGERLLITLDDRPTNNGAGAGSITPVQMLFGGVYLFTIRDSVVQPINPLRDAAMMKRYFDTVNQNIMAPEIALSLGNDATPKGYIDSPFTICDPVPVNPGFQMASTGSLSTSRTVLVSGCAFFVAKRLIFTFSTTTPGLSATLQVRVRDASGYSLTNDYIDVSQYSNAPYACDWTLCNGSQLIFDYSIVDQTGGPGTWNVQCFIEGQRRRRA